MERVDDERSETDVLADDELVTARVQRWLARDRAVVLERRLAELESELHLRDDRLRRLADELLYERERRRDAEATLRGREEELGAMAATFWWRLGRLPRWLRRHVR